MGNDMAAGLALSQASEQIDTKIEEIETLLTALAQVHRNGTSPLIERDAAAVAIHGWSLSN